MQCICFICKRKFYARTHVNITRHWKSTLNKEHSFNARRLFASRPSKETTQTCTYNLTVRDYVTLYIQVSKRAKKFLLRRLTLETDLR